MKYAWKFQFLNVQYDVQYFKCELLSVIQKYFLKRLMIVSGLPIEFISSFNL